MELTQKQKIRLEVMRCLMLAGKNQKQLAEHIGIDRNYLSRWLTTNSSIRSNNTIIHKTKRAFKDWGVDDFNVQIQK